MLLYQAILADQTLMLLAIFRSDLVRMIFTKYKRHTDCFFNLFSNLFVSNEFNWILITFVRTVIRVTERAIEFSFNDKLLAFFLDHFSFHTLTASSFTAAD